MISRIIATVTVTPNMSLPGSNTIVNLIGGLATWATFAALAGVLLSAAVMAIGAHSSNGRLSDRGKTGLITSIVAAIVAGGAAAIINFAVSTGGHIH